MTRELVLSKRAIADLRGIWLDSFKAWAEAQADPTSTNSTPVCKSAKRSPGTAARGAARVQRHSALGGTLVAVVSKPASTPRFPLLAVALATGLAFTGGLLGVRTFGSYGSALFLATPLLSGVLLGWLLKRGHGTTVFVAAVPLALLTLILTFTLFLVSGEEGLICLLFATPLVLALTLLGLGLGLALADAGSASASPASLGAVAGLPLLSTAALLPGAHVAERAFATPPGLREVKTSVLVDAPIARVWEVVIGFPRITAPPDLLSRLGIAYPVEATLDGEGVGAVRRCVFSTGAFVEPITRWEPPTLLAFDVEASPPPMKELSFHEHVDAPHLSTAFVSKRGQFALRTLDDGRVLLEGTTWYTQGLSPEWYWGPITDHLIHRIHRRVLDHIAEVAAGR